MPRRPESEMQAVRRHYVAWYVLSDAERRRHRLPGSKAAFARDQRIDRSTLTAWENADWFNEAVEDVLERRRTEALAAGEELPADPRPTPQVSATADSPVVAGDAWDSAPMVGLDPPGGPRTPTKASDLELFERTLRLNLELAAEGDPNALKFIAQSHISKQFLDEMKANVTSSFPGLEDIELIEKVVDGWAHLVVLVLRTRGWEVSDGPVTEAGA